MFTPLEQASVLRWQKRNARNELYKRLVSVFAIIRLTLKSAGFAYDNQLPIEPQLKQIEQIELFDHAAFIERDKQFLLGRHDFIVYQKAIEIVKTAVLMDDEEKVKSCAAVEEIILKAARLGYLDMKLVERFGDQTIRDLLREAFYKAEKELEAAKRHLQQQ
jgi:hypothetical protein